MARQLFSRRKWLSLCLAISLAWPGIACARAADEYVAKAAFLYNLVLFSTFAEASKETIYLCVLGRDPFGPALSSLEGKSVGSAKLGVRFPKTSTEAIMQCRILFVSASEEHNIIAIAGWAREAGILTVTDVQGAARKGIMVQIGIEDKKIVFEFNNESARAASVAVSSKVLRLARAVY